MKVTLAVIFSLTYLAAVFSLPASREPKDEVEFVPLEDQNEGGPIVDTGVIGGPFGFSPFDGLFESLAGMMARMRQQMDFLLRRLPIGNATIEDSPFPGFPNIADLDLSKGNTTSVTKVIDGHKVVINETEYKQEGPNSGAFFKVRIIDVLKDSSEEMTTNKNAEEFTSSPKDTESVEDSIENEIPKNREVFNNIETFDEPDSSQSLRKITTGSSEDRSVESLEDASVKSFTPFHQAQSYNPFQKLTDESSKRSSPETFSTEEDNSIESAYRPPDLSRDTFVNQLMADAGAPTNPDAEVFSDVEFNVPYPLAPRQPFEKITNPR